MTIEHAPRLAYTDDSRIEPAPRQHVDDMAVDTLAAQQKARLAEKRGQGFNGWDDPRRCSLEKLSMLMAQSMCKGKVVDVANFAAMLYSRGAAPELVGEHAMRSLLRGAREHRASVASQLRTILADDSHAFTFQTMGQYRTALLKAFDNVATAEEPTPQACAHCGGSGRQEDVFEQAAQPLGSVGFEGLPETLIAKLIEQHDPCGQSQRTYEFARAIERALLSRTESSAPKGYRIVINGHAAGQSYAAMPHTDAASPSAQQADPNAGEVERMLDADEQSAEEARGVDVRVPRQVIEAITRYGDARADAVSPTEPSEVLGEVVRLIRALLAAPAAGTGHGKPFGWASASNGNYFTRSERIAKRIGGLVPVYTAPQAATGAQGLIALLREARDVVKQQWDESNTAADHGLLQRIDAALAASKEGA